MKIIERIKSAFSSSSPQIHEVDRNGLPTFWGMDFGGYKFAEGNSREFLQNGYGCNPYVYIVVNSRAKIAANLPYKFIDSKGQDVEVNTKIEEFIALLDSGKGYENLIEEISTYLDVTGNVFIHKQKPIGFNTVEALDVIHVPDVDIETQNGLEWGEVTGYTVTEYYVKTLDKDEVIHLALPNCTIKTNWGLSPLVAGQVVYEGSNNEFTAEARLHGNMGADGIVSQKPNAGAIPLGDDEIEQLQSAYSGRANGAQNMGKILATMASVEFTRLSMDATKLKTLELNEKNLRIVCALYSLDSKLYNDPTATTYNNMPEAEKSSYEKGYIPHANKIFGCLSKHILKEHFGIDATMVVDTNKIPVLNERDLKREEAALKQVEAGILTKEEFRTMFYPELGEFIGIETNESVLEDEKASVQESEARFGEFGVGGVQGILAIQASVAQGITQYESGISTLVLIYGLSDEDARQILGDKEELENARVTETNEEQ